MAMCSVEVPQINKLNLILILWTGVRENFADSCFFVEGGCVDVVKLDECMDYLLIFGCWIRVSKHTLREVPFGFRRGTVPDATLVPPRCPKNAQK